MAPKKPKNDPWVIGIKVASNGAIGYFFDPEGEPEVDVYKFESSTPKELVGLLYDIKDRLICESRYSQERIEIKIVHGDKYECEGCDICKVDAR